MDDGSTICTIFKTIHISVDDIQASSILGRSIDRFIFSSSLSPSPPRLLGPAHPVDGLELLQPSGHLLVLHQQRATVDLCRVGRQHQLGLQQMDQPTNRRSTQTHVEKDLEFSAKIVIMSKRLEANKTKQNKTTNYVHRLWEKKREETD